MTPPTFSGWPQGWPEKGWGLEEEVKSNRIKGAINGQV